MKSLQVSSKQSSKTASKPGETVRLNRFLADCGLGSRRGVEALITDGKISVNGTICKDLASQVDPSQDEVRYQGKILSIEKKTYLVLNKPMGYVVSQKDEFDRKTVYDLLPDEFANLPYAGRLDKNTEGLLLFCNDGTLIKQLTHPSYEVEKVYRVQIEPKISLTAIEKLRQGVVIDGGLTQSAGVFVKSQSNTGMSLKVVISEGRKRQIRLMIKAVGARVINLKRVQFGPLFIKDLPVGRWRPLTADEVRALYKTAASAKLAKNPQTPKSSRDKT